MQVRDLQRAVGAIRGTHTGEVNPHCTGHGTGSVGTFNRNAKALRGAHLEIAALGAKVLISRWFRTPAVVCTTSVLFLYPTFLTPDAIAAKNGDFGKVAPLKFDNFLGVHIKFLGVKAKTKSKF